MRRRAKAASALALGVLLATACLAPGQAQAAGEGQRILIETLGAANQASFAEPTGLAVDQGSGDVYAIDGRSEAQEITVSATAGKFKLRFGTETTELEYKATSAQVEAALSAIVCGGAECLSVFGGPGDETGSKPYKVFFGRTLATTDVPQIECEDGSPPLSGGSGCTVATTTDGVNGNVSRWHADGTPADFSGLSSNAIDGKGPGADQTPQQGLHFPNANLLQVAVDDSGGETDGDIYVTLFFDQVVDVFAPSGEYLGQMTEYKEGAAAAGPFKPFDLVVGVGVDAGGNVYLGNYAAGAVSKYDPAANPVANGDNVANFSLPEATTLAAGSGPTAGSIFVVRFNEGGLFKLDALTGAVQYGGKPIATGIETVTVDPLSGNLYAAKGSEVLEFDASGPSEATLIESIPAASKVTGIAVDGATKHLYVARKGSSKIDVYAFVVLPEVTTGGATQVKKITATVNGTLNPEGVPVTECTFEYGETESYGETAPCEALDGTPISGPGDIPADEATHSVSADISGLDPNTTYHFRLVAANATAADEGADKTFETLGPPVVKCDFVYFPPPTEEEPKPEPIRCDSVLEVAATTAKVASFVSPRGEETEVAVEYVSEAQFNESGYAEASVVPSPATQIDEEGEFFEIEGVKFVEFSQELTGLHPDTTYHFRILAQNQVDPPVHGEDKTLTTFALPTGLPDGRAYEQVSPPAKLGEVFPLDPRAAQGGTCSSCVSGYDKQKMPMRASPDGNAVAYEGGPFSGGLAAGANEYIANRAGGWATTALSKPQFPDTEQQGFKAFSADLSRGILYQIEPSLSAGAPSDFANLYYWQEGGSLQPLITAAPPNRSPGILSGNKFIVTYAGANAGTDSSPPFSHVVFQANDALTEEEAGTAPEAPPVGANETDLYEWSGGELRLVNVLPGNTTAAPNATIGSGLLLRHSGENFDFDHAISDDGSRVFWSEVPSGQVYVREGGESTVQIPDPGKFLTASADGSRVLLSDGMLYGLEEDSLTDLTEGQGGFQGTLGASEDLSRVYFVDTKALTPLGEENANGEHAEEGKSNLYLSAEGTTTFIGILLGQDNNVGLAGSWHAAPGNRLAQVSADGRYLAFMSKASLTGYDNTIRGGGECRNSDASVPGCFEVFEYDAVAGSLSCPSCNPSGQRPLGLSNLSLITGDKQSFPQPRNLPPEGEGRLFFESQDVLSAADTNGHIQDVYEWEPNGVGSCARAGGCITLISSGHSPKDSQFIDATPSGDDVFFTTREALVPQDIDDFMDLYDARVGGGIEEVLHPPCEGEACKGPGSTPPSEQTASSATFSGPGNRPQHHKKHRKHRKRHHRQRSAKHDRGGRR